MDSEQSNSDKDRAHVNRSWSRDVLSVPNSGSEISSEDGFDQQSVNNDTHLSSEQIVKSIEDSPNHGPHTSSDRGEESPRYSGTARSDSSEDGDSIGHEAQGERQFEYVTEPAISGSSAETEHSAVQSLSPDQSQSQSPRENNVPEDASSNSETDPQQAKPPASSTGASVLRNHQSDRVKALAQRREHDSDDSENSQPVIDRSRKRTESEISRTSSDDGSPAKKLRVQQDITAGDEKLYPKLYEMYVRDNEIFPYPFEDELEADDDVHIGFSVWTPAERATVVNCLQRTDDPERIHEIVNTKSVYDISSYIAVLVKKISHPPVVNQSSLASSEESSEEPTKESDGDSSSQPEIENQGCDPGNGTVHIGEISIACEIGDGCCEALNEAALQTVEKDLEDDRAAEENIYQTYAILDEAKCHDLHEFVETRKDSQASDVSSTSTAGKSDLPNDAFIKDILASTQFFDVPSWLSLSASVFMNSSDEETDNWHVLTEGTPDTPSIFATASRSFYDIALEYTRRLVSATIFQANSRIRSRQGRKQDFKPYIRRTDVDAALDLLCVDRDSAEYWVKAPRRCGVAVTASVRKRKKEGQGFQQHRNHVIDYNQAEGFLRQEGQLTQANIESSACSVASGSDEALTDEEDIMETTETGTALDDPGAAYDDFIEELDQRQSRAEERFLWGVMNQKPPSDLGDADNDSDEPMQDEPRSPNDRGERNWRDHVEYCAEWERYGYFIPRAAFAREKSDSRLSGLQRPKTRSEILDMGDDTISLGASSRASSVMSSRANSMAPDMPGKGRTSHEDFEEEGNVAASMRQSRHEDVAKNSSDGDGTRPRSTPQPVPSPSPPRGRSRRRSEESPDLPLALRRPSRSRSRVDYGLKLPSPDEQRSDDYENDKQKVLTQDRQRSDEDEVVEESDVSDFAIDSSRNLSLLSRRP